MSAATRVSTRAGYTLTPAGEAAVGPRTGPSLVEDCAPEYVVGWPTVEGLAALDVWPANRIDHEPTDHCAGRDCLCEAGRWSR